MASLGQHDFLHPPHWHLQPCWASTNDMHLPSNQVGLHPKFMMLQKAFLGGKDKWTQSCQAPLRCYEFQNDVVF